jgi:hypothetical protein
VSGVEREAGAGGHTPGPWKAVLQYGSWMVRQDPANWNGRGYQHIATFPADRKGTHYGDMFAANARLIAAAPDLYEALVDLEELFARDGESSNDRFERVAALFLRDTGVLAPGKDDPFSGLVDVERRDRFEAWYARRAERARAALASATPKAVRA